MSRTKRFVAAGVVVLAVAAAACNEGLTDLNRNPNSPEDVPSATLFTFATRNTVGRFLGAGYSLRATDLLAQHVAQVQYPDEDTYARLDRGSTQGYFHGAYIEELEDYTKIIAKSASEKGTSAPAEIMRAWVFSYLTNTWGDIPYSQALQGDAAEGSLAPAYDTQLAVYTDLFARLTTAASDLATASNTLGGADPIYDGDPASWRRFANSLRARFALTLINQNLQLAGTELAAALAAAAGGIIDENSENAELHWPGDGIYNNPWSNNFVGRDDHRVSKTMMDIFANTSDPRVAVYAMPATRDTTPDPKISKYCTGAPPCYVGLQNGLSQATAGPFVPYTSRPGEVFYPGVTVYGTFGGGGASFPSFIFTAAEGNFILAEAAERGIGGIAGGSAQAKIYYDAGIRASMAQWGITNTATQDAYINGANVSYLTGATQADRLTRIAIQKWLALYTDGGTAWTEWRRTCQPASIAPGPGAIQPTVPRRLTYTITEYSVNRQNVMGAVASQGADDFNTRTYFDRTPTAAPTYNAAACLGD
jgi:hypothetical protein